MNLDELLSNLRTNLDNRIEEFHNEEASQDGTLQFMFCPECGTKVEVGVKFCPECGHSLSDSMYDDSYDEDNETDYEDNQHYDKEIILFTDTSELARKYEEDQGDVADIMREFLEILEDYDYKCHLLDVADYPIEYGDATWMDYRDLLDKFMVENSIKPRPQLALFIVGGNDVIPQPNLDNPSFSPSPWGQDEYQEIVFADFMYCIKGATDLEFLDYSKMRCNVGRLPLEMGKISTNIKDDLDNYFDRCIYALDDEGLIISRAVMTTNEEWIPASREMSRNLPMRPIPDEENMVMDNMYISPMILADMDKDDCGEYYEDMKEADMLVFNLHGACEPNASGFYSSDLAFSIDMLENTNAQIFNTVACWGARYIRYKRKDSMLLNALYHQNVLLYSGACVPAMGKCGSFQYDDTWLIRPAAYSESFMARFSEYLCIGTMTAGEAFLKAKCDYYNSSRMIEEDEITWATVLMFNLYGCPIIGTKPDVRTISRMQNNDGSKMHRIPFRPRKKTQVLKGGYLKESHDNKSILESVRSAVDENLRILHEGIVNHLYNELGVEPSELFSVEKYEKTNGDGTVEKGYLYNYARNNNNIRSCICAKVDEQGRLLDAMQTK